ncbi:MAG: hypothetical protein R3F61_15935 [Myxococcota bacterium]
MTLLWLVACSGGPAGTGPDGAEVEDGLLPPSTWVDTVAADPQAFADLTGSDDRDGWVALHAGDPYRAWSAMQSDAGRHRAAREVVLELEALAVLHRRAARELGSAWSDAPEPVRTAAAYAVDCEVAPEDAVLRERFEGVVPDALPSPVWTLPEDGFTRVIHDPCFEHHLARSWKERAGAVDGLAQSLFGPVPFHGSARTTAQDARDDLTALRRALELRAAARPPGPGSDLVADLDADGVARIHTATALAHDALVDGPGERGGSAEYARVLLELAHPAEPPAVGPLSPRVLYAHLAQAELASGDPRRALVWLGPLGDRAAGVRETVSDLAVLRGLSRVGDSKEE